MFQDSLDSDYSMRVVSRDRVAVWFDAMDPSYLILFTGDINTQSDKISPRCIGSIRI